MAELTLNGAASVHTLSMLSLGRLMVTLHPAAPVCVAVPPGHSAESNAPPVLLFTVKVKLWLPHEHTAPMHTLLVQSLAAEQCLVSAQCGQVGPPQSMSVSSPFLMLSVQVGATDVDVLLVVLVVVEVDSVELVVLLVDVVLLLDVLLVVLLEVVELVDVLLLEVLELVDVDELVLELLLLLDEELVVLDELVLVVLASVVVVDDGGGGQALPTPLRQTSLAPVPPPINRYTQVLCGKLVHRRNVSAPLSTV